MIKMSHNIRQLRTSFFFCSNRVNVLSDTMSASTLIEIEWIDNIENDVEESAANVEHSQETTSLADSIDEKVKHSKTFEWFYDRNFDKYFEFVKAKSEKSVAVQCLLCPPRKPLVCTTNSAYNLNIHIKVTFKSSSDKFEKTNLCVFTLHISLHTLQKWSNLQNEHKKEKG